MRSILRKTGNLTAAVLSAIVLLTACGTDDPLIVSTDIIRNANEADLYLEGVYADIPLRSTFEDAFVMMPMLFSDNAYYAGNTNDSWQKASDMEIDPEDEVNFNMFADFYSLNQDLNIFFAQIDTTFDESLTDDVKDGFRAEGRTFRAVLYYYLVSYWGTVPLIDENTDQSDTTLPNATYDQLYDFIEDDLLFADENISKNTYVTDAKRLGATAVKGMLARLYLQTGDWPDALDYAEDAISTTSAVLEEDFANVLKAESPEHVWIRTESLTGTSLALYFLQPFSNGTYEVRPRTAVAFEEDDARRNVALSVPGTTILKYQDINDNSDPAYLFRLSEIYLIAAEAAARTGDFVTASMHINVVRERAGLDDIELDAGNYEEAILRERNSELCFEGFHRLLDLRRFGIAEDVLGEFGYDVKDAVWPIPQELLDDFSSLEQNPGYE